MPEPRPYPDYRGDAFLAGSAHRFQEFAPDPYGPPPPPPMDMQPHFGEYRVPVARAPVARQFDMAMGQYRPSSYTRTGETDLTLHVDRERKLELGAQLPPRAGPYAQGPPPFEPHPQELDEIPMGGWHNEDTVTRLTKQSIQNAENDVEARRTATPPHMRPSFFQRWDGLPYDMVADDARQMVAAQDPRWLNASLWYSPNYYPGAREHFWLPEYGQNFYHDLWGPMDPQHAVLEQYFRDRFRREEKQGGASDHQQQQQEQQEQQQQKPAPRTPRGGRRKSGGNFAQKPWSRFW